MSCRVRPPAKRGSAVGQQITRRRIHGRGACLCLLLLVFAAGVSAGRPKTDIVVMKNGDRYTCEIISLAKGQLKVKTVNTTGTVPLDWAKVDRIDSEYYFAVELTDGRTLAGIIKKLHPEPGASADFRVAVDGVEAEVSATEVVSIARSGERLSGRLSGGISAGFSYAKGNNETSYNVNGNLDVKARTHEAILGLSTTFTGQPGGQGTDRSDLNLQYWKTLSRNWLIGSYNDLLRSQEQELNLRAAFGAVVGRRLKRTNRTLITASTGAVYANERYKSEPQKTRRGNAEGLLGLTLSIFRFDSTQLTADTKVFPSITDTGRVRMDSNINGKIDLTHSVNWTVTIYSNYDSRPPTNTPRTDYGVSFGLGWTFP
jgi:putative salt-induced outer membrane protein YdiY